MKHVQRSLFIVLLSITMLSGITFSSSTWDLQGKQPGPPVTLPVTPGIPFDLPEGVPAAITPGEQVQLLTPGNAEINVTVGKAVTINVTTSRGPPQELPEKANATFPKGFDGKLSLYLTIELNDSKTSVDAELTVPYSEEDVGTANLREETLVLHYWDPEAEEWKPIENPGIDTAKNHVTGTTTHFSIWTILGQQPTPPKGPPETIQPGIPFDLEEGIPAAITPGEKNFIKTPGNAEINVTVGKVVTINVTTSRGPPRELPEKANATFPEGFGGSLGVYLTIELNESETSIDAEMKVPYTDKDVGAANLREETLMLHYWDPEAEEWKPIENPGIDTAKNHVTGTTTHFSIWTILGASETPTSTTEVPATMTEAPTSTTEAPTTITEAPATTTPVVPEIKALGILIVLLSLTIGGNLLVATVRKHRD